MNCFFATDLHGSIDRYTTLFQKIEQDSPRAVFLGGDLLPSGMFTFAGHDRAHVDFISDFLVKKVLDLRERMAEKSPEIFLILGNDDGRFVEAAILDAAARGAWRYVHNHRVKFGDLSIYGYSYVPPTPFQLKDWERYDVSRYVDPGCISPEEGYHSIPVAGHELRFSTIANDLALLSGKDALDQAIFLFHTPPYQTCLDRADLDGKMVDHAPLDTHVGSIAVRRFIEKRQPLLTLHGHVHESARITGNWREQIGRTHLFSAAHDGPELALVRFDTEYLADATRELL